MKERKLKENEKKKCLFLAKIKKRQLNLLKYEKKI
jgi:hypothetical protein